MTDARAWSPPSRWTAPKMASTVVAIIFEDTWRVPGFRLRQRSKPKLYPTGPTTSFPRTSLRICVHWPVIHTINSHHQFKRLYGQCKTNLRSVMFQPTDGIKSTQKPSHRTQLDECSGVVASNDPERSSLGRTYWELRGRVSYPWRYRGWFSRSLRPCLPFWQDW